MVDILNPPDILLKSISINEQNNGPEKEVYFYHGDHFGSANWITDYTGAPIQYIHYAPYGELIDNQQASGSWYDERYKFTGKERDWETGYDYFGARYWWRAGTWLSVDPLSDKYPEISPYAYCNWNPVKYIFSFYSCVDDLLFLSL
jgi:RHS repeat-associated protein